MSSWLMASLDQVIDLQAMASVRETQYGIWNGLNYNYTGTAQHMPGVMGHNA